MPPATAACPREGLAACQWRALCGGGWLVASANFGAFRPGPRVHWIRDRGLSAELPLEGGQLNEGLCVASLCL